MKKALTRSVGNNPPLLYIEWLDAGVVTNGEWITKEEAIAESAPGRFINQTAGWLISETSEAITIASQLATNEKEPRYDLVMFIPKSLVRKRKVIKL